MRKKVGIIGLGNMGRAVASGLLRSGAIAPGEVMALVRREASLTACNALGIEITREFSELATSCGVVFMCVKSADAPAVVKEFGQHCKETAPLAFVSMCSGIALASLQPYIKCDMVLLKAIADINVGTGDGLTVLFNSEQAATAGEAVGQLLALLGTVIEVPSETECDRVSSIAASIPAWVSIVASSLVEAGLYCGVRADMAYDIVTRVMESTARGIRTSGLHPDVYRQLVTSPGGVVIKGVHVLEKHAVRAAFIEAVATVESLVAEQSKLISERETL